MKNIEEDAKKAGILALVSEPNSKLVEILFAHNTPTLCMAYTGTSFKSPKTLFSKLDDDSNNFCAQSIPISMNLSTF